MKFTFADKDDSVVSTATKYARKLPQFTDDEVETLI